MLYYIYVLVLDLKSTYIQFLVAAYAWLKCEREEDKDCYGVLKTAKIIGRAGSVFGAESRYVRLSLIRSQDDFDLLLQRLNELLKTA